MKSAKMPKRLVDYRFSTFSVGSDFSCNRGEAAGSVSSTCHRGAREGLASLEIRVVSHVLDGQVIDMRGLGNPGVCVWQGRGCSSQRGKQSLIVRETVATAWSIRIQFIHQKRLQAVLSDSNHNSS